VTHRRVCLSSILVPEQWRAAELEEWREREIFWIEWTRTDGRCEDKDGVKIKTSGLMEVFLGWCHAGSKIFLVVAADISK
jgi:hypothetical protein